MSFIESVKGVLPDYAKDTKLNLDAVLLRSTLDADVAMGCAVAALAATGNGKVLALSRSRHIIRVGRSPTSSFCGDVHKNRNSKEVLR